MRFFLLFFLTFSSFLTHAQAIIVCQDCPNYNIQKAIEIAKENDTIIVQKGIYKEHNILINKSLTLIGKDLPNINAQRKGQIFLVRASDVIIKGFRLANVPYSATTENAAIHIEKSRNFKIEDNIIEQTYFGVIINKGRTGIVKNNKISGIPREQFNSGNAIHL